MKCIKLAGAFLLTLGFLAHAHAQDPFTNGLVAHYSLDGNANDSSGTNNGSVYNLTYTTNRFGVANAAILLNGNSSYVGIPYSPDFDFSENGQFSLSVWFKINGIGSGINDIGSLIVKSPISGDWDYGLEAFLNNQPVLWAGLSYQYACVSTNLIEAMTWHNGLITYSNADWRLYQDGNLIMETKTPYTITRSSGGIAIGRKGEFPTDYFNGAVDDVRIYNRALPPSEVHQLYAYEAVEPTTAGEPIIDLIKAVRPSFSNLQIGTQYQLQVSSDLNTWTNQGDAFTAMSSSMVFPQYWDVDNWSKLFFRLQKSP